MPVAIMFGLKHTLSTGESCTIYLDPSKSSSFYVSDNCISELDFRVSSKESLSELERTKNCPLWFRHSSTFPVEQQQLHRREWSVYSNLIESWTTMSLNGNGIISGRFIELNEGDQIEIKYPDIAAPLTLMYGQQDQKEYMYQRLSMLNEQAKGQMETIVCSLTTLLLNGEENMREKEEEINQLKGNVKDLQSNLKQKTDELEILRLKDSTTKCTVVATKHKWYNEKQTMEEELCEAKVQIINLKESESILNDCLYGEKKMAVENFHKLKQLKKHVDVMEAQLEQQPLRIAKQLYGNLEEEFLCAICRGTLRKAVFLNCGHSFCHDCINRWKETKEECPTCRNIITQQTPAIVLNNIIDKIMAKMVNNGNIE